MSFDYAEGPDADTSQIRRRNPLWSADIDRKFIATNDANDLCKW